MKNPAPFAGALLAALSLMGTAFAQEATTLNFLSAQQENVVQPMIDAFQAANPDIKIVHQSVPFNDLNAATESRIGQGDTSIDLIHADTPRVPAFASKEYLLNLDDHRAEIEAAVPNAVDIEQVSWDGSLYAYPMWTSTQLLFYNKDLLEKAGVEPPSNDPANRDTWATILEKAAAAQKGGAEWGLTFQQVDRYYQLQMLFESAGAGPGLTGDGLLTPAVNTEEWVKVADWYRDTFETGLSPRGVTPEQTDDLFINGQVAFVVGGPWAIGRYDENPDLQLRRRAGALFRGRQAGDPHRVLGHLDQSPLGADRRRPQVRRVRLVEPGRRLPLGQRQPAAAGQRRGLQAVRRAHGGDDRQNRPGHRHHHATRRRIPRSAGRARWASSPSRP